MLPSDPGKQARMEEFLRKSLLGEDLINTQFHLFSSRSSPSGRVAKPRVLCANNVLLAKSSNYFVDLLSSDANPSDSSLSDLTDDNDVPNDLGADEYGYGSDSDLDDDEEGPSIPVVAGTKALRGQPAPGSMFPSGANLGPQPKDEDRSSDNDSDSDSSDIFVMSPEHPKMDILSVFGLDGTRSVASSETAVQNVSGNKTLANYNDSAVRLRSMGRRHILVKDTAYQTWYTLLNYLYTGKYGFLPLCSTASEGQTYLSSTTPLDEPRCSAKSMYRLACKVGLDNLRNEALSHIRNNLSEYNILAELSCSLLSKHSELLEVELDVLYTHIASPPVVSRFPLLAQRIALKGLPHGADIIVGIHTRMLRERQLLPTTPAPPSLMRPSVESAPSEPSSPMTRSPSGASVQLEPESKPTTASVGSPLPEPRPVFASFGSPFPESKPTTASFGSPLPAPRSAFACFGSPLPKPGPASTCFGSPLPEPKPTPAGFGSFFTQQGPSVFGTPVGEAPNTGGSLFSPPSPKECNDDEPCLDDGQGRISSKKKGGVFAGGGKKKKK